MERMACLQSSGDDIQGEGNESRRENLSGVKEY